MSQILNSLIISDGPDAQAALEVVMSDNLEGYILSFLTIPLAEISGIDREPDLIFIDKNAAVTEEDVAHVVKTFPRKTTVVLDEDSDRDRRQFLKTGVDEVMSLDELKSGLGKHLIEKLLAFRDLADAETRIEQSEERFRGIIEHSHDIIMLLDAEGTIVYTSPAFGRLMEYDEWEVLGQLLADFVHEDDRDYVDRQLKKLATETSGSIEFLFRKNDGTWRVFEAIGTNLLRNSMVQSLVLNVRDVTEHRQTEDELEKYRLHLEDLVAKRTQEVQDVRQQADTVIAASPDALIALDNSGFITFISQHYRLMYPKSVEKLQAGRHISEAFELVVKELRLSEIDPRYDEMRDWWMKPRGTKEFRMQNVTWVRLQAKRMQDDKGIVISSTNITDYKRQQALLAQQSDELSTSLDKEKMIVEQQRTFVSMVSHEFRTPLTIIDGNAQIIESRGPTIGADLLKKRAVTIRSSVDRLVRLIETILSAHMMEIGKLSIYPEPCDLTKVLHDIIADQQDITPAHKIKADIRNLPPVMKLDSKVIRQAVSNLLSNAVKYSPRGDAVMLNAFPENGRVIIEVQDQGVGIPEHELPKMFTKYYRASTSGGIPGSGLGLSLVKQFVEMHNGSVSLRSKVGVGTVVTINLPMNET